MYCVKVLSVLFFFQLFSISVFAQWTTSGNDISNSNSGNVGIGTSSPATKLHVNGDLTVDAGILKFTNNWVGGSAVSAGTIGFTTNYGLQIRAKTGVYFDFAIWDPSGGTYMLANPGSNNLTFGGDLMILPTKKLFFDGGSNTHISEVSSDVIAITTGSSERFRINDIGQVGIGVTNIPTGYKLAVAGNIITEKVRVKLQSAGWPDYVFNKDYSLLSLKEVELFIKENNHLPGVPSAAQIGKEGLDLGDGQAVLLKKIEELTLYMIELSKKIERLELDHYLIKAIER